uniref:Uncharacterized protein n=1 Tax=Arundo donax TaxID=35708 RepID=A0A0A9G834_ARUDO
MLESSLRTHGGELGFNGSDERTLESSFSQLKSRSLPPSLSCPPAATKFEVPSAQIELPAVELKLLAAAEQAPQAQRLASFRDLRARRNLQNCRLLLLA